MQTRIRLVVASLILLFGLFSVAAGQRTGNAGTVSDKPRPKPAEPTRMRNDAPARVETRYVVKTVTPTTGQLFVATDPPGAVILLEPVDPRNKDSRQAQVPEDRRDWVFNDLKPGEYRVAATKAEYQQNEKTVTIQRNKPSRMTLDLQPISYSVTIKSNTDGELKYGKRGQIPNSVRILNKSITLRLSAGDYEGELEAAEPVYKTDRQQFSVAGDTTVEFRLKLLEFSKDTLRADWTQTEVRNWDVPPSWRVSSGNLIVKGAGVALTRDESKRYYKDFQIVSDLKITNGVGAGFALRAQDLRNYYLLQFTGAQADEPFYVRLFVVKNGVEQRVQAIKIPNAAATALKGGQFFSVAIKVADNRFTVEIVDNETATNYPLGILIDSNKTFTAGAAGIAARSNDEGVIWRFIVCTDCPKD